jgi:phosphomannomutase/phosphoglucomutase
MNSSIDASIFRAYDIRGIVDQALSETVVEQIGMAVAVQSLQAGVATVALGRDGRLSGPRLMAALQRGIRSAGAEVIDVGMVPTPILYFTAQRYAGGSGIMLTGSHNPPDYNGCKIMVAGNTLAGDEIAAIYQQICAGLTAADQPGGCHQQEVIDDYLAEVERLNTLQQPLRVVTDYGNGVAGAVGPALFERLGVDAINLYAEVDGHFPNHHPDPSKPENLAELRRVMVRENIALGLAFDGDGDRLGVIAGHNGETEIIWADRIMQLLAEDVLREQPGSNIVFDVKCSGRLAQRIHALGGNPIMSRTGHSLIKRAMREQNAPLAGEMSGHFFFGKPWYGFDDGLFAAARLLSILSRADDPAALLHAIPTGISTPELNIATAEGDNHAIIDKLQKLAEFPGAELNTIDGVRADYDDGWGLVRASNTTPVLVLRFEADTESALKRIQQQFREQLQRHAGQLRIDF